MLNDDIEQRNEFLAAIIESSEDAIISKNLQGIIQSWNKAAERVFGYSAAEVIGSHISILIPEDRQAEEDMIISNLKAGRRVEHFQTIRRTKEGKQIHISLTVSPIKNGAGVITGASKIARDITRQKEAEEMQARYAEQLEQINAATKTLASEINEEKILDHVTAVTTKLSGASFGAFFYNKTDAKGESYMLFALSGAPREAFEKFGMPRNTAVFSKTFSGEGILRSDDITKDPRYGHNSPHKGMPQGHLPVVSYLAVPVIAPSGAVIGGLFFGHFEKAMFTDQHERLVQAIAVTAAVALDKARLYEEINILNAKKDEFISFASHELKTPLTTIKGYLQLADKAPDMYQEILPKINKQVNRLSAIIGDLLDITKIQAGALALNHTPINARTIINDAVETARTSFPRHVFRMELPSQDILLNVDSQKIGQVLINLLTNAAKYSDEASTVIINCEHLGNDLRISITDHGIGMENENLDKIFSRYYRVSQRGPKTEGLGLGLYISREIIEAHHGKIWAESELGKGSTFTIEIPVH